MRSVLLSLIEEAPDIPNLKEIEARISAIRNYYKLTRDPERLQVAQEAFNQTGYRLSLLWQAKEKDNGGRPPKSAEITGTSNVPVISGKVASAADLGIGKAEATKLRLLALLTQDDVDAYIEGQKEAGDAITQKDLLRMAAQRKAALLRQANAPGLGILVQGDCRDILPSLDPTFDCLMTDPPYSTEHTDFAAFTDSWLALALSKVKPTGTVFIWAGSYPDEVMTYLSRLAHRKDFIFGNILVWHYTNTLGPQPEHTYKTTHQFCFYLYGPEAPPLRSPWLKDQTTVFEAPMPRRDIGGDGHPWEKPATILETLLATATDPGQRVLDPFSGSGAIGVAASKLGRPSLSIEMKQEYIDLANSRGLHLLQDGERPQ